VTPSQTEKIFRNGLISPNVMKTQPGIVPLETLRQSLMTLARTVATKED